ncbi:unnamed protein product [Pieris macdunnoughi]|uniref:Tyrosine-protein kinase Wsck n=1 Tax=Pieris macdunnoughi TaxID=345717 RepID=A0A821T909_9NEOP|nr:unnamed protein product [Pieris macdunnoughi]
MELLHLVTAITVIFFSEVYSDRGDYVGCFKLSDEVINTHTGQSVDVCISACEQVFYKYALIGNESTCFCGNTPGKFKMDLGVCTSPCPKNETQICGGENAVSVYDTEITKPGPPTSLETYNVTESTVRVQWTAPQAYTRITSYIIWAVVVTTYADTILQPIQWRVPNNTYQTQLLNLQPGSVYNISVGAMYYEEESNNITVKVETVIGTPDPSPPDIKILQRKGNEMLVHIPEAINVNGPVSMYRIVVSIELFQQGFITENLGNYSYAQEKGLPYYITAELDPDDIKNDFVIGDERTYNGFYNAPLALTNDIEVSLGVVSEKNHIKKIRYAESTKTIILNINEPEVVSGLVVALGAGIAIGIVLLLIGLGLLIVLRKRINIARLERGSQSMPLSLSEPCLEIENAGFLQDEVERVDYYSNLKRKLWNIPRNFIEMDISNVVGMGNYGKFIRGTVQQHGVQTTGLIQVISDKEIEKPEKKLMLQELDLLIKSSEHDYVISMIGICETNTSLLVVLQDVKMTLKNMLLESRQRDLGNNKFCLLPENKLLEICANVACGMEYLHSKKIMHKKLCCRNVLVTDSGVLKVSGFGLSCNRPLHSTPDFTRWTSHEMLRQTRYNPKADVWSFGCLMWEVFTLGGTPYSHTVNKDVAARVLRGMRPSQPSYVGDELFQLCLQCWQVDPDERPTFTSLVHEVVPFADGPGSRCLSLTYYNGFNYEPHIPEFEIIS